MLRIHVLAGLVIPCIVDVTLALIDGSNILSLSMYSGITERYNKNSDLRIPTGISESPFGAGMEDQSRSPTGIGADSGIDRGFGVRSRR